MAERHLTRRRFLTGGSAALASGLAGCTLAPAERGDAAEPGTDPPPIGDGDAETPTVERLSQSMDGSYADVYRDAVDSVAQIRVYAAQGQSGGTGWLYDGDYVVTNQHVVSRTDDQYVRFADGGWTDATVVGTDLYSDLAVLSVDETPDAAEPLSLLDSDPPVGTEVMAIGTPFGLSGSVSVGVVSGVNRTLPAANSFRIPDAIQTDAPVNPGNSGGPLVTLDGGVAGVVNAGRGDSIGFAISAPLTRRVVDALVDGDGYEHSYMGVEIRSVGPLLAEANDVDVGSGVYVNAVRDGAPSDGVLRGSTEETTRNGLTVDTGGDVVVAMDGTAIPTRQALSSFLALETVPGDTVEVTVVRDGGRRTVDLTLETRPDP